MKKRILYFDMDGVLVDFGSALKKTAFRNFRTIQGT